MTKPHLAEVITLFSENASNIPAMLRQSANSIETETDADSRTVAMIAVQLAENGQVIVYGWGATDSMKAIATLELGKAKMVRELLESVE